MKRFFVCFALLAAMMLMVSCGGGSDNSSSTAVCSYGAYECHNNDSYFCGYSGNDLMWLHSESCTNGCNASTGKCKTQSDNDTDSDDTDSQVDTTPDNGDSQHEDTDTSDSIDDSGDTAPDNGDTSDPTDDANTSEPTDDADSSDPVSDNDSDLTDTTPEESDFTPDEDVDTDSGDSTSDNDADTDTNPTNPCDQNPCISVANSTGDCSVSGTTYSCVCNSGYFWNNSECKKQITLGEICTGQNKCYNDSEEITCPSQNEEFYGQDAQYAELGTCVPQAFRVEKISGDNVVVDLNIGLVWQQTIPTDKYTWDDAKSYCNNSSYAGYNDWRLPTPLELLSIVDNVAYPSSIDTTYFPNISGSFWSSSTRVNSTDYAWYIFFPNGYVHNFDNTDYKYVRCVRGDSLTNSSFESSTVNGNIIVKDSKTGLIWQKSYVSDKTWQQALDYCETLTYAGYTDWRLPNKNELASLVNYEKIGPASDFTDIPDNAYFWSSSTYRYKNQAWIVHFGDGRIGGDAINSNTIYKSDGNYVRCVRSGLSCEDGYFLEGSTCINPCDKDPCNNAEHSICTPHSFNQYTCSCDNAADNYFWSGFACVNPCDEDPCNNIPNSTGICTAISWQNYSCGCNNGYFWNGETCVSPCDEDPCSNIENSNGICVASSSNDYSCGCRKGYNWRHQNCEIIPKVFGNICTNLKKCYDNSTTISCPASLSDDFFGQDTYYANQGSCIPQSFTVQTNSSQKIVVDNNTGLMWQQTLPNTTYTWENADLYCTNLIYAGYKDWRLPSPQELLTIVDNSRSNPAFYTTYFSEQINDYPDMQNGSFWSSSITAFNSGRAWLISFYYGSVGFYNQTGTYYARCVRGNSLNRTFQHSEVNGDGIITDSRTGLIWQLTYVSDKTWQQALDYCETLTYAGYTDWRLPNKNELATLVDYAKYNPASNFNHMPSNYFWSSSTNVGNTNYAWGVNFRTGEVNQNDKTDDTVYVRCVR